MIVPNQVPKDLVHGDRPVTLVPPNALEALCGNGFEVRQQCRSALVKPPEQHVDRLISRPALARLQIFQGIVAIRDRGGIFRENRRNAPTHHLIAIDQMLDLLFCTPLAF